MKTTLAILFLAKGIACHVIQRHTGQSDPSCQATGKAVYLLTNDANNAVVALPIDEDGTLAAGTVTLSGGKGSNSIDGTTMKPAQPDALVSQSSLAIAGNVSLTFQLFTYSYMLSENSTYLRSTPGVIR